MNKTKGKKQTKNRVFHGSDLVSRARPKTGSRMTRPDPTRPDPTRPANFAQAGRIMTREKILKKRILTLRREVYRVCMQSGSNWFVVYHAIPTCAELLSGFSDCIVRPSTQLSTALRSKSYSYLLYVGNLKQQKSGRQRGAPFSEKPPDTYLLSVTRCRVDLPDNQRGSTAGIVSSPG